MDNRRIYSTVIFLFVSLMFINSLILMGTGDILSGKISRSILKNNDFNKYIGVSSEEVSKEELDDSSDVNSSESEKRDDKNAKTAAKTQASSGAVVIEQSTKRVLYGENMDSICYPASTTKVLTALIVLNNLELDRVVVISKEAEGVEGSSIYLRKGDRITVEDLLFGLMLRSGNDAATALAIEAAGSVDKFAILMNETAYSLGARNSNFVNPHGLHDDNHYTTAYDLALITAAAYENLDFVRIVSSKQAKITINGEAHYIANKNKLLTLYEGANGVKTGYTKRSGRCLVGGAMRDGMQLVSVVLNCGDMWNETIRILNDGFDNYEMKSLDNALLDSKTGKRPVEIVRPFTADERWRDIRYPLRKDGSEYLIVKAA